MLISIGHPSSGWVPMVELCRDNGPGGEVRGDQLPSPPRSSQQGQGGARLGCRGEEVNNLSN